MTTDPKPWKRPEARYYPRMRSGTCRRVVLDTNLMWYEGLDTLRALRNRGFLLSISEVALTERWARAFREDKPSKLRRVRELDPLLDPELRVVPIGWTLEDQLGCLKTEVPPEQRFAPFDALMRDRWSELVAGMPDDWKDVGSAVDNGLNLSAERWLADLRCFTEHMSATDLSETNEDELLRHASRHFTATLRSSLPGGAAERLNGSCHVQALHVAGAAFGRSATENDREDLRVLQTLGAPVFIVTGDARMIRRVDRSGTHQGPRVRSPAEMLLDDLPTSLPWGAHARRYARTFVRHAR